MSPMTCLPSQEASHEINVRRCMSLFVKLAVLDLTTGAWHHSSCMRMLHGSLEPCKA